MHTVDLSANTLFGKHSSGISAYSANSTFSGVLNDRVNIVSDLIGNPTAIGDTVLSWNGRQLQSATNEDISATYTYNTDGQRVKKTVSTLWDDSIYTYEYFYNGEILAGQKVSKTENGETTEYTLAFMYDNNGDAFGFLYNGEPYYYIKNAQNDVVLITNADGGSVVLYQYDAWGNVTQCFDGTEENIAAVNPILYRSYYYDAEMGMYYLNSRYYVPALCRFLNADSLVDNRGLNTQNLFQYCVNNPVNNTDSSGRAWYHWAIAAAVVVGCAVAVVVTAGGAAAGLGAVLSVACGYTATTASATVAAYAFIGSLSVIGSAAIDASMNSSSAKDFAKKGNWGTVAATLGGAIAGGAYGYCVARGAGLTNSSQVSPPKIDVSGISKAPRSSPLLANGTYTQYDNSNPTQIRSITYYDSNGNWMYRDDFMHPHNINGVDCCPHRHIAPPLNEFGQPVGRETVIPLFYE